MLSAVFRPSVSTIRALTAFVANVGTRRLESLGLVSSFPFKDPNGCFYEVGVPSKGVRIPSPGVGVLCGLI